MPSLRRQTTTVPERPTSGLRQVAARGSIVNTAFTIGVNLLALLRGFIVATFLTPDDYGVWGILVIALLTFAFIKDVGIPDKFVQQDEEDQEVAFQKAWTLELVLSGSLMLLTAALLPVLAIVYDEPRIVAPALVMLIGVPGVALQAPTWILYRSLDFAGQRRLMAVDPIVGFVVTVALAVAGLGYWALVAGTIAGAWAGAIAALRRSPYPLRLRFDRATARGYVAFSWPLLVVSGSGILVTQVAVLVASRTEGAAAVGAITLAASVAAYTRRVDEIVTQTVYPVICAVKDRTDLLLESFTTTNRLALMWGLPFGIGLALFAPDLVDFVLGEEWKPATRLLQAFGVIAAVDHIGFNWSAFYRARGDTRPLAVVAVAIVVSFTLAAIPLMISDGLDGLALAFAVQTLVQLGLRAIYLRRLFAGFGFLRHALRSIAPTVPAVAVVLAARALGDGPRSGTVAVAEVVAYLLVTAVATVILERSLLRELRGYLGRASAVPA